MTINPTPTYTEQSLFEVPPDDAPITSNGQARNIYGQVVEEVVCRLMGLTPIQINGQFSINFDAGYGDTFYEIKSLNRSSKLPLYEWRRKKDGDSGAKLFYLLALHNVKGAKTKGEVWEKMGDTMKTLLLLPAKNVSTEATKYPLQQNSSRIKNPRMGYNREGYKDGYRNVPAKGLRAMAPDFVACLSQEIYGVKFEVELFSKLGTG